MSGVQMLRDPVAFIDREGDVSLRAIYPAHDLQEQLIADSQMRLDRAVVADGEYKPARLAPLQTRSRGPPRIPGRFNSRESCGRVYAGTCCADLQAVKGQSWGRLCDAKRMVSVARRQVSAGDEKFAKANDATFDELGYLDANPDVEQAVRSGFFPSGRRHFELHGRDESRSVLVSSPAQPKSWLFRRFQKPDVPDYDGARRFERLERRLYDLEVAIAQLSDMLSFGQGVPQPPPKHLQVRVVGSYNGSFVRSGFVSVYPQLNRALSAVGHQLDDFQRILDFGCGSGRAIYALSTLLHEVDLFGTDIDGEAIGWLQQNWPSLASYSVCPSDPPMPYEDETFDFVFGISVVTHLPEDLHLSWLLDLKRVTKPGGFVLLTTHGEHAWRGQLTAEQMATIESTGYLYTQSGYGASVGLPDFYETAFHSHAYIRRVWSRYFDVVGTWGPEVGEHQDTILLRRL